MSVRIKICGITNENDALAAADLGADAIGLNFYARSPRCISVERAAAIVRALPPFVEPVALFVNEPIEHMIALAQRIGVRTIQVHGDDVPACLHGPFRFVPAFAVKEQETLRRMQEYLQACKGHGALPAAVLVDAHVPGSYGGTGQPAPWDLLVGFAPGVPIILAGGLTPDNVADAIRRVRPYAVDVASGVEASPGQKDRDKMRRFIDNARAGD